MRFQLIACMLESKVEFKVARIYGEKWCSGYL